MAALESTMLGEYRAASVATAAARWVEGSPEARSMRVRGQAQGGFESLDRPQVDQ